MYFHLLGLFWENNEFIFYHVLLKCTNVEYVFITHNIQSTGMFIWVLCCLNSFLRSGCIN